MKQGVSNQSIAARQLLTALVLICLAAAAVPTTSHSAEWQTYLTDEFNSAETMFYTGPTGSAFYAIDEDGRYVIDGMLSDLDSLSALTENLYYYYLETECEVLDTSAGELASAGLVFHYSKRVKPGELSYYVFYIYADGYYGAKRVIGDRVDIVLPLSRSEQIDTELPNILAVDAQGTRFDLYINGKYVDGFTDVRIDGGGFGFYISKNTKAAFDDFVVKIERRETGKDEPGQPSYAEGPGSGAIATDSFMGYRPPVIPRDPNRPIYPWEIIDPPLGDDADKPRPKESQPPEGEPGEQAGDAGQDEATAPVEPIDDETGGDQAEPPPRKPEAPAPPPEPEPESESEPELELALEPAQGGQFREPYTPPVRQPEQPRTEADPKASPVVLVPAKNLEEQERPAAETDKETELQLFPADLPPIQLPQEPQQAEPAETAPKPVKPEFPAETAADAPLALIEPPTVDQPTQPAPDPPAADSGQPKAEEPSTDEEPKKSFRRIDFNVDDWGDPNSDEPPVEEYKPPAIPGHAEEGAPKAPPKPETKIEPPADKPDEQTVNEATRVELGPARPEEQPAPLTGHLAREEPAPPAKLPAEEKIDIAEPLPLSPPPEVQVEKPLELLPELPVDGPEEKVSFGPIAPPVITEPDSDTAAVDSAATPPADEPEDLELPLFPAADKPAALEPAPEAPAAATPVDATEVQTAPAAAQPVMPGVEPGGRPRIEIADDFSRETWPVSSNGASEYRYFGAAYEINNLNAETMAISYQENNLADLAIAVDIDFLDGISYVGYGLAARFMLFDGAVSYYGMFISQTGEYLLLKVLNGQEYVLKDWTASSLISPTLMNRVKLELSGSTIQAFINGKLVTTVMDGDIRAGGYALLAGPGTSARFDNLAISGYEPK